MKGKLLLDQWIGEEKLLLLSACDGAPAFVLWSTVHSSAQPA